MELIMISTKSLLLIAAIVLLPVVVTLIFKFIDSTIGPIVLFYSILIGPFVGLILVSQFIGGLHVALQGVIYVLTYVPSAILFLNYFIWLTYLMGEMDYNLL